MKKILTHAYWHAFHFVCSVALAILLINDIHERSLRDDFIHKHNEMMKAFAVRDMPRVKELNEQQKSAFQKAFGVPMEYIQ